MLLAHSSAEWVSSEWPVCPVSETASPQRMGTALTYARRYAPFTLVGIAGEDDLDAAPVLPSANSVGFTPRKPVPRPVRPTLPRAQSAALRAQLQAELVPASSSEEALAWAQRTLPTKITLTPEDAGALEGAFEAKMVAVGAGEASEPASAASQDQKTEPSSRTLGAKVKEKGRGFHRAQLRKPCPMGLAGRQSRLLAADQGVSAWVSASFTPWVNFNLHSLHGSG